MIEEMHTKGLDVTIFFYNPNIHPRKDFTCVIPRPMRGCIPNTTPQVESRESPSLALLVWVLFRELP